MEEYAEILEVNEESIRIVVDSLRQGNVIALPTETVYGLAAAINNETALRKIFEIKGRPFFDPLIVHVLNLSSMLNLVDVKGDLLNNLRLLIDAFCPGPLTFILKKKKNISDIITAGKKTLAVRIPAHSAFREILRQSGPLAAPSANPFGYVSPTCANHVLTSMGDKISYILDGGSCEIGLESTILDLSGRHFAILRPGAITATMVEEVLGKKVEPYRHLISIDPSAPGILKQHYSPQTKLRLFQKSPKEEIPYFQEEIYKNIALVYLFKEGIVIPSMMDGKNIFWLSENGELEEVARNVFGVLQQLDKMNFNTIYCQIPEEIGIGIAIKDRLSRAAAKF